MFLNSRIRDASGTLRVANAARLPEPAVFGECGCAARVVVGTCLHANYARLAPGCMGLLQAGAVAALELHAMRIGLCATDANAPKLWV